MFMSPTYKCKYPDDTFRVEAEKLGKIISRFNVFERIYLFMQIIVHLFLMHAQILRFQLYICSINLQKFYTEKTRKVFNWRKMHWPPLLMQIFLTNEWIHAIHKSQEKNKTSL